MANVPGRPRREQQAPTGARFTSHTPQARPASARRVAAGSRPAPRASRSGVHPAYTRAGARKPQKASPLPIILALVAAVAVVAVAVLVVFPAVFNGSSEPSVAAGQQVSITVPEGASGDTIATLLSDSHVIDDTSEYYAAVKRLNAETSLKPGDYLFTTGQDPVEVVKQLVNGPNVEGVKLTVPEGRTVSQLAALVESTYGIAADDFLAQAKASNYAADYSFLSEAANDSLEGFLFPKTYTFSGTPTADQIIRAMLDQYQSDVLSSVDFAAGRAAIQARYGVELSDYDVLNLASIVEREGLNAEQRAHVASVFLNRLSGRLTNGVTLLNSDATMMYVTGGAVTADDLKQDSPYNTYLNPGLPPTPICSPSLEAINATLNPTDSNDLYFYITQDEEYFSETYEQHQQSWE